VGTPTTPPGCTSTPDPEYAHSGSYPGRLSMMTGWTTPVTPAPPAVRRPI
jgi:hypothetical protein